MNFAKRFDSLWPKELAVLEVILDRDDVLVKGHQTKEVSGHRGGCLPFFGLGAAALMGMVLHVELPGFPWRGAALGIAVASGFHMIRALVYARISKKLLAKPQGWLALGWTKERLIYRSFDDCLFVPWIDVEKFDLVGTDAPRGLTGTLWVHLVDGKKVLIDSREGALAGRPMADWAKDLEKARGRAS